jgi:hypothetical protein
VRISIAGDISVSNRDARDFESRRLDLRIIQQKMAHRMPLLQKGDYP